MYENTDASERGEKGLSEVLQMEVEDHWSLPASVGDSRDRIIETSVVKTTKFIIPLLIAAIHAI